MKKSWSSTGQTNLADEATRDKLKLNPVWRGVGCLLIIAIPIASWFLADFIRVLHFENQYEWGIPYLYDVTTFEYNGVLAGAVTLIMYALLTVLYGWIGRPQLGPEISYRERPRGRPRKSR